MKRFAVFAWNDYDASGGMGDYQGSYDFLDLAVGSLINIEGEYENKEIWDMDNMKTVYKE